MISNYFQIPLKGTNKPYVSIYYDPTRVEVYGGYPPDRNYRDFSRGGLGMAVELPSYGIGMDIRGSRAFGNRGPMGSPAIPPFSLRQEQTTQVRKKYCK